MLKFKYFIILQFYMKVIFVEARYKPKIRLTKRAIQTLCKYDTIGIVASVQFCAQLDIVKSQLQEAGLKVIIGEPARHAIYPGQILGCDVSSAIGIKDKVDCFLYIGDGYFHPLGVALQTNKLVYIFNPLNNKFDEISNEEKRAWLKKRAAASSKIRDGKILGILVSVKPGQCALRAAERLCKKLRGRGKEAHIFIADDLSPTQLNNFEVDGWINTACPRLIDDQSALRKPIVNLEELAQFL